MESVSMPPDLCLQKVKELQPVKIVQTNDRHFDVEQVKATALNDLTSNDVPFDTSKLIPFLVGAIQDLASRVEFLERIRKIKTRTKV